MGKKQKTDDEFKVELKEKRPELEPLSVYIDTMSKVKVRDIRCGHVWEATPNNLLSKNTGCPECALKLRSIKQRKSDDVFREELAKKNPNLEPLESYVNSNTKIHSRCKKCNTIVFATPHHMLMDAICCPECVKAYRSEKMRKEEEQFKKEFKKKHPNLTVLDSYVNNRTKITVLCEDCFHIWKATPHHLLDSNSGCPVCIKYSMEKPVRDFLFNKNVKYKYNFPLEGSNYNGSCRPLFLDFLIETEKGCLVIETDGRQHFLKSRNTEPLEEIQARDRYKDKILKERGWILIRVTSSPTKKWGFKNHITLQELFALFDAGIDENGNIDLDVFRPYDFNRET